MRTALCLALAGCAADPTRVPRDTATTDPGTDTPDTTDTPDPTGTTPTTPPPPPRDPCTTDAAEPLVVECLVTNDVYVAPAAAVDGDEVTIIAGYQGGWMILASVATESVGGTALIEPTLTAPELSDRNIELYAGYTGVQLYGWDAETCVGEPEPLQILVDPNMLPGPGGESTRVCNFVGGTVRLQMDVLDPTSGRSGSCVVDLVVGPESCY